MAAEDIAVRELLARLLTVPAAEVCRPFAGAVVLALAAAAREEGQVAVPRGHAVRLGDVPVLELVRVAGATPVEVGEADGCVPGDLARAAPCALLVADRAAAPDLAAALWACRLAGTASVVATGSPLAALDAGADLVAVDVAAFCGGPPTGIVAGEAGLVAACGKVPLRALFAADPADFAATLAALRAAAGDPAGGRVMPLAG